MTGGIMELEGWCRRDGREWVRVEKMCC